jgi:putative redox protein
MHVDDAALLREARRDSARGVEATITNDRMYAKDYADCVTTSGYIHTFDVKLKLIGNLTQEQREKLLSIAGRCPVYKTLTSEIRINESLV